MWIILPVLAVVFTMFVLLIASFVGDAIDDIETGKDNENDV